MGNAKKLLGLAICFLFIDMVSYNHNIYSAKSYKLQIIK